jgi:Mycolic acid cyclopropane synthetase
MRDQTHKHSGRNNATNWLERFESSAREVSAMFGADFVRMWRLYVAGTVAGFHVGILQLFQMFSLATIPGRCLEHALTYTSKIPRHRTNGVKHACKSWNKGALSAQGL